MSQDTVARNKEIVANFWNKVFNEGDMTPIDQLIGPKYTYNGKPSTAAGTKAWAQSIHQAFPDLHFTIKDLIGEGDKVAVRWILTGTDAKSGQRLENTATNIITLEDGQAISNWQTGGTPADFKPIPPDSSA